MNLIAFNLSRHWLWLPPKLVLIKKLVLRHIMGINNEKLWMRISLVFIGIISCLMQVSAAGFAQRLTYAKKEATLEQVFREVERQTSYKVLYSDQKLNDNQKITVDFKNADLDEVMELCLKGLPLTFEIEHHTIIIRKKESSVLGSTLDLVRHAFLDVNIEGIITDENNLPLPGATVTIKRNKKSVIADKDGRYSLKAEPTDVLVVSYVGYISKEVKVSDVKGNAPFNIVLIINPTALEQVQIVSDGFQNLPKERATGSFEVITKEQLQHSTDPVLLRRLEGITTSMNFNNQMRTVNSSNPTGGSGLTGLYAKSPLANLTIRGRTSLAITSTLDQQNGVPLVVIDGIASPYNVDQINPNDVETIVLLKDAAAASIWGSRAANGVIVVTTKKGSYNKPVQVSFNSNFNVTEKLDLFYKKKMSTSDFVDAQVFLYRNQYPGTAVVPNPTDPTNPQTILSPVAEIENNLKLGLIDGDQEKAQLDALRNNDIRNDYTKYFLRNAVTQSYSLALDGGSKKVNYRLSGGYDKTLNNTQNSGSNRLNISYNVSAQPLKDLELSGNITYSLNRTNDQAPINRLSGGEFYPYTELADDEGNPLVVPRKFRSSFLDLLESKHGSNILSLRYKPLEDINEGYIKTSAQTLNFNLGGNYKILEGFSANVTYNYARGFNEQNQFYGQNSFYMRDLINRFTTPSNYSDPLFGPQPYKRQIPLGGQYTPMVQKTYNHTLRGQLNLNKTWNEKHELSAIAGIDVSQLYNFSREDQFYGYNVNTLTATGRLDYSDYLINLYAPEQDGFMTNKIPFIGGGLIDSKIRAFSVYANAAYTFNHKYTLSASVRKDASSEFGPGTNQTGTPYYSLGSAWNINKEAFYNFEWLPSLKFRATFGYSGNVNPQVIARPLITRDPYTDYITDLYYASMGSGNVLNRNLRPEKTGILNLGLDFGVKGNRISGSLEYYSKWTKDLITGNPTDPSLGYSSASINTGNLHGYGIDFSLNTLNLQSGLFKWSSTFLFSYNKVKVTKLYIGESKSVNAAINLNGYNTGYDLSRLFGYKWAGLDPLTGDPRGYVDGKPVTISATAAGTANLAAIGAQSIDNAVYFGSSVPVYYGSFRNTFSYGQFSISANFLYKLGYYFRRPTSDVLSYVLMFGNNTLQGAEYASRWKKPGDELITNVPSQVYTVSNNNRDNFYRAAEINIAKADHIRLQEVNFGYTLSKKNWFIKNPRIYANVSNLGVVWRANKLGLDPDINDYPNPRTYSFGLSANF